MAKRIPPDGHFKRDQVLRHGPTIQQMGSDDGSSARARANAAADACRGRQTKRRDEVDALLALISEDLEM